MSFFGGPGATTGFKPTAAASLLSFLQPAAVAAAAAVSASGTGGISSAGLGFMGPLNLTSGPGIVSLVSLTPEFFPKGSQYTYPLKM
jgi:hypothetical protein